MYLLKEIAFPRSKWDFVPRKQTEVSHKIQARTYMYNNSKATYRYFRYLTRKYALISHISVILHQKREVCYLHVWRSFAKDSNNICYLLANAKVCFWSIAMSTLPKILEHLTDTHVFTFCKMSLQRFRKCMLLMVLAQKVE